LATPSVESRFGVGFDAAIGSRNGDARQDEASRNLAYVEKNLIVLIDAAAD
jgi:hypothetical protein